MKKTLLMSAALAALVLGTPLTSHAEDAVVTESAVTESVQASEEVMVKELTLKDGTKVLVKGDDVFVLGTFGKETPAPDGIHVLEDDTSVTTKDGKIVHPEESATEETHSAE